MRRRVDNLVKASFALSLIAAPRSERRLGRCIFVLAALISASWCSVPSFAQDISAQDARTLAAFNWKKDATGNELAASRSDSSFNYFDVGDLSYYSQYLVEQDLRRLAVAAGLTMEHVSAKNSSVATIHDTKVFVRLKNDKPAFKTLGFADYELELLENQVTSDSPKCLTMTLTDGSNNIFTTIILLSEKFDRCLVVAELASFGIAASDISAETLIDVCVLYEGRRRGLRGRQDLTREIPGLRNLCIKQAADIR